MASEAPGLPAPAENSPQGESKATTKKWPSFGQAMEEQRRQRMNRTTPQPWIIRKLSVGVVAAIVVWTYYVYIGRMCFSMIKYGVGGSRGEGSE